MGTESTTSVCQKVGIYQLMSISNFPVKILEHEQAKAGPVSFLQAKGTNTNTNVRNKRWTYYPSQQAHDVMLTSCARWAGLQRWLCVCFEEFIFNMVLMMFDLRVFQLYRHEWRFCLMNRQGY